MCCVSFRLLPVLAALLLGACVGAEADVQAVDRQAAAAVHDGALRSGDKLRISVFGEDKLSGEYQVDQSGKIFFPLAGPIAASSLTREELAKTLARKLSTGYLRDPKVSVAMASPMPFYILGEVEKPGRYDYDGGLNIWRAIAMAGGQTYRANSDKVYVQHAGDADWHEVELSPSVLVDPGDLIRVPDRWF